MGLLDIVLIAAGLSMDAFAISISLGLSANNSRKLECYYPAFCFGFFQGLMPFIGCFAGTFFAVRVQQLAHWIAFVFLGIIGSKMILESFSHEKKVSEVPFHAGKILVLAIITSIDALMVGVTFAFFKINLVLAMIIIGIVTFLISIAGIKIGQLFGERYKPKAEFIGGAVLLLLGIKILTEHWPKRF